MLDDLSSRADFPQVDERRAHGDLDGRLGRQAEQQRFDQLGVFGARAVHLPVSGDQRPPHRSTSVSRSCTQRGPREGRGSLAAAVKAPLSPHLRLLSQPGRPTPASSLAISRTSLSSLPSTITRMTGSVPDGRSTIRPLLPSRPSARRHGLLDLRRLHRVDALRDPHVLQHLRILRHRRGELGEAAAGLLHDRQHLQCADQRVAGRGVIQAQHVAGGLAAEHAAGLLQHARARNGRRPWRDGTRCPLSCSACSSPRLLITVPTTGPTQRLALRDARAR